MTDLRSRLPLPAVAVALCAVALVAMVVDRRGSASGELFRWTGGLLDLAAPVQRMIAMPLGLTRDAWDRYVALLEVRKENETLRRSVAELAEENLQLREALVASGRLQRIAEMREQYEVPMLPAELVGLDASPWFRSILLDRGRERGVRAGMPVISEQGLVGLVTATSGDAAKVMLVLDRQSAVDAVVQRSRLRGVVRGLSTDALEFEFVARDADVEPGDLLISSGLGGVHPKGLRIGEVTRVSDPGAGLLQTAEVRPAVDFSRLEQVFVMLRRGPSMALLYSGDDAEPDSDGARPSR